MKKIDLHIHTVPTMSDSHFVFSLEVFKNYVQSAKLDAVAVTNHDIFDGKQFLEIRAGLGITVFPGIEVNLKSGHILVIADGANLEDFEAKTAKVTGKIQKMGDKLSVEEFQQIFGDLKNYLVIPHYDKDPSVDAETLEKLSEYIAAGEVSSAKKFVCTAKDETKLTPVLFSDSRMKVGVTHFPPRQTYINCGELTLDAIKLCLRDKGKVQLSEKDGNKLWQVFENGQMLSTGLNILLGERSSGKTYTLDRIFESGERVKYIKQFSLVQQDDAAYEREFKGDIQKKRGYFSDNYLSGLKIVIDDVINVDLHANGKRLEKYLSTLLKSAEETDRRDAFSKTALFDEVDFPIGNVETLDALINSVRQVIENIEYRDVVEKHLDFKSLKALACELIEILRAKSLENEKNKFVNSIVKDIKQLLKMRTSAVQIEDVDLYNFCMDQKKIERFKEIVGFIRLDKVIRNEPIQGFRIEVRQGKFSGAGELKAASGKQTSFSDAFGKYDDPYEYLQALSGNESLSKSDLYKFFAKISYTILNKDGHEVSGGERSEFRLLQEIADAQNYDILLIDEPESSFDNLFLKSDVNEILRAISDSMPVVVVTHNSTVGGSVRADYLLYARKEVKDGAPEYSLYSGFPTDKKLLSSDGKFINSHEILMDSLEAGADAYNDRRHGYEAVKN